MRYSLLAVLLTALYAGAVQSSEEVYGVLFTTPAQRTQLDNRFRAPGTETNTGTDSDSTRIRARTMIPLRLNGTLISNLGKKEIWINGKNQLEPRGKYHNRISLLRDGRVRVKTSTSAPRRVLKPGQILDPGTGHIRESYQSVSSASGHRDHSP